MTLPCMNPSLAEALPVKRLPFCEQTAYVVSRAALFNYLWAVRLHEDSAGPIPLGEAQRIAQRTRTARGRKADAWLTECIRQIESQEAWGGDETPMPQRLRLSPHPHINNYERQRNLPDSTPDDA